MFEPTLDPEQVFGHDDGMGRTRVRRRRRLALATMAVAVGVVLSAPVAAALGRHGGPDPGSPARRGERVYVVRSGDTLWSIAERVDGDTDPRAVVDAIAARNAIDPGSVFPGESLVIPAGA